MDYYVRGSGKKFAWRDVLKSVEGNGPQLAGEAVRRRSRSDRARRHGPGDATTPVRRRRSSSSGAQVFLQASLTAKRRKIPRACDVRRRATSDAEMNRAYFDRELPWRPTRDSPGLAHQVDGRQRPERLECGR